MNNDESSGHRHARLQGILLDELRLLLLDDVADPTVADVQITAVELSVDYRHARVHFVLAPRADGGADEAAARDARVLAERGLTRATPFLRQRLADAMDLKRVPELRFIYDAAVP